MCKKFRRQFVENPANKPVSGEKKELISRLLIEQISFAGIARAVCVSETWLQGYVNGHYQGVRRKISVISEKRPSDNPVRRIMVICPKKEKQRQNKSYRMF